MTTANKLSTLWIVVLFNMVFADVLGFIYPGFIAQVTTGQIDGITITPAFLLLAAVFIEIAIVMIYLSCALPKRTARTANLAASLITIIFVSGGGSLAPHYIFFGGIEVITLLYIARLAWVWPTSAPTLRTAQ